jgi:hypothetical protein
MKRFFNYLVQLFEDTDEICPLCKEKMDCYGSHPWGVFTYHCECGHITDNTFRR